MRIIEINALSNGAHRNQNGGVSSVPSGWAAIPVDPSTLQNFPFGSFEVEEINSVPTMIVESWIPGEMPEPEPIPEPESEMTVWDELDAAYQEGVNTAYDE